MNPLRRALTTNSRARLISESGFKVRVTEPVNDLDSYPSVDGIYDTASQRSDGSNGIRVHPISEGGPGGVYWIRVWGWMVYGNDPSSSLWIPCLLAEMVCAAGTQNGLPGRLVTDKEWFAGSIQPTQGSVNVTQGETAYAIVGLFGVQKFQFDIAPGDGAPAFGNALFAFI